MGFLLQRSPIKGVVGKKITQKFAQLKNFYKLCSLIEINHLLRLHTARFFYKIALNSIEHSLLIN